MHGRMMILACLMGAMLSVGAGASPPEIAAVEPRGLAPVYDATLLHDKPSDPLPGLRPIRLIYAHWLWGAGQDRYAMPPEDRVRKFAREHAGALTVLDIEHLPTNTVWGGASEHRAERGRDLLGRIVDVMHDEAPGLRLGLYGVMPVGYGKIIERRQAEVDAASARLLYDRDELGRFALPGLADRVDFITFSGYARYVYSLDDWIDRNELMLRSARQYQKQVLIFLTPTYHPASDRPWEPIEPEYWRGMIRWSRANADGVVIWSRGEPFDPDAEWWRILREEISE